VSRTVDISASLVCLALAAGVCVEAGHLGFGSFLAPEPGFFPWIGGLALAGLSISLLVQALRRPALAVTPAGEWAPPALLLGALVLYVPLLEPLGYSLATTGLCIVALRILKTRSWTINVAVSLALAVGTYLLFCRALGVELPAGSLFFGG